MKKLLIIPALIILIIVFTSCEMLGIGSEEPIVSEPTIEEAELKPPGIKEEVFHPEGNLLIIRLTNNTGEDISLSMNVTYRYEDAENSTPFEQQYLPDGEVYIVAEESDDVIDDYNVEYSYTEGSDECKSYYEQTPHTVSKNSDGSIDFHLTDNSASGYDDELYIFYEDAEGKILGYDYTNCTGVDDFSHTFSKPDYDYEKYEVVRDRID